MQDLEQLENNNFYGTSEFAEGVSILYAGIALVAMEQDSSSSQKVTFLFKRSPELDALIRDFWNDKLQVSPRRWHAMSRELKARIRAELSLQGGTRND